MRRNRHEIQAPANPVDSAHIRPLLFPLVKKASQPFVAGPLFYVTKATATPRISSGLRHDGNQVIIYAKTWFCGKPHGFNVWTWKGWLQMAFNLCHNTCLQIGTSVPWRSGWNAVFVLSIMVYQIDVYDLLKLLRNWPIKDAWSLESLTCTEKSLLSFLLITVHHSLVWKGSGLASIHDPRH